MRMSSFFTACSQTKAGSLLPHKFKRDKPATRNMAEPESVGNINSRLPNELLALIFNFISFEDLKNALLVCRLVWIWRFKENVFSKVSFHFDPQALERGGGAALPLVFTQAQALSEEDEGMWMGAREASLPGDHFNLFGQKIQIFC